MGRFFSLIELLIIVAIILIIAAIAIPNLMRARMSANESSAAGSLRTINTAKVSYTTTYPTVGFTAIASLGGAHRRFTERCSIRSSRRAAWAFLVLCYSWRLSFAERVAAGLFLFLTLCATEGLGEHYCADLVVAFPFSHFILPLAPVLAEGDYRRLYLPLVVGAGATGM